MAASAIVLCVLLRIVGGTLDIYLDKNETKAFGMSESRFYYVRDGTLVDGSFRNPRVIPNDKSGIRFTWNAQSSWLYSMRFQSSDESVMRQPSTLINAIGIVPRNVSSFFISLPCAGTGEATFRFALNISDLRYSSVRALVVSIQRPRLCGRNVRHVTPAPPPKDPNDNTVSNNGGDDSLDEEKTSWTFKLTVAVASTILAIVIIIFIGFQYRKCNEPKLTEAQARAELITLRSLPGDVALGTMNPKTTLNGNCNDSGYASRVVDSGRSAASKLKSVQVDRRRISLEVTVKEGTIGIFCLGKLGHFDPDMVSVGSRVTREKSPHLGGEDVLVKAIKGGASDRDIHQFLATASKFLLDPHRNVLTVIGITSAMTGLPAIVYPFVSDGVILKEMLRKHKKTNASGIPLQPLSVPQLVYISAQLARGLNHLSRNRVVHADIATRNCLITGQLQVMITDGVLGSDLYPDEYDSVGGPNGERLPVKWMAAETLAGGPCRTESNVWSFGVSVWEIMTQGDVPYEKESPGNMLAYLTEGQRLDQPPSCPNQVFSLMGQCWALSPEDRPNFHQLTISLHEFYAALTCFI